MTPDGFVGLPRRGGGGSKRGRSEGSPQAGGWVSAGTRAVIPSNGRQGPLALNDPLMNYDFALNISWVILVFKMDRYHLVTEIYDTDSKADIM